MDKLRFIVILFIPFAIVHCVKGLTIEQSVKKANIYYQQPLSDGKFREFALDTIKELASKKDIKVIIHGFMGNRFKSAIIPIKEAYMAQGADNIFLADWEDAASLYYFHSRGAVGEVGLVLAKLLEHFLNKFEIQLSEVHIIGHSLGAHIAGIMGRYFNGSVGRVTGLDPALPLFSPDDADGLHSNDAVFVDVIHTGCQVFGDITPRGTVDFYPDFGEIPQKGCNDFSILGLFMLIFESYSCSHNKAAILYAESISLPQNFPSIPCSLTAIQNRSANVCLHEINNGVVSKRSLAGAIGAKRDDIIAYMGEGVSKSASGFYYLETNGVPPLGIGLYTVALTLAAYLTLQTKFGC